MESILEMQRRFHEERERLIDTMTREWLHDNKSNRETINSEHRLKMLRDRFLETTSALNATYMDETGPRDGELQSVAGPNELAEFYGRLKALKDVHRRNPDEIAVPLSVEFHEMIEAIEDPRRIETDMVEFSDEEGYGRFMDMHSLFDKFINLKGVKRVDYVTYISTFELLSEIAQDPTKKTGAYRDYLLSLLDYLAGFLTRIRPLLQLDVQLEQTDMSFSAQWSQGSFPGWQQQSARTPGALTHTGAFLDLSPFGTADELHALGLDRLKSALLALGLKCGGTLKERADRLFATKGKQPDELDKQLFSTNDDKRRTADGDKEELRRREVAGLEARVYRLAQLLRVRSEFVEVDSRH